MSPKRNRFPQKFFYEELPVAVLSASAGVLTAFTDTVCMPWLSLVPVHAVLCIRIGKGRWWVGFGPGAVICDSWSRA